MYVAMIWYNPDFAWSWLHDKTTSWVHNDMYLLKDVVTNSTQMPK